MSSNRTPEPNPSNRNRSKTRPGRETFPADVKKGVFQHPLEGERYGHARETISREPTGNAREQGASNVGQDESSGSETIAVDPTRFPEGAKEQSEAESERERD